MCKCLLIVGLLAAMGVGPPTLADPPLAQPAEIAERIVLEHLTGAGMMQLLTSKVPTPRKPGERDDLRSADSLVPRGLRAMAGFPKDGTLLFAGTPEAVRILQAAARVADVQPKPEGNGEVSVTIEPVQAALPDISAAALKLPDAGRVTTEQRHLILVGKPTWVYRTLRVALRLEIAALAIGVPGQP